MAEITLEDAPRKAHEHFDKGFVAFERGNLDYAMDMFESALELSPQLLRARKFLRAAALKKQKTTKQNPLSHALSSLRGIPGLMQIGAQAKKKPLEALKAAEKLLRADPLNLMFINKASEIAIAAGLPEVAIMNLELAKEHNPVNVDILEWLGQLYQEANRMRDARVVYEEIVAIRPNDPKAIKMLKDATALDSMQKGGWSESSSYRDMIKDTKEATLLEQASKAVKTSHDVEALIAENLQKIQREPQNINYRRALAELYARVEQFDAALAALKEAQQMSGGGDPQLDRAHSTIRIRQFDVETAKLVEAGKTVEAIAMTKEKDAFLRSDVEEKVKRYPNDLQFRYDYGTVLFDHGQINEAIQQFQLAQKNPQRRIRALYYLALCFKQKQQFDIALEQLEKANTELSIMDDVKKDIIYELGGILEAMGRTDKAAEYYKEIYAVDIGFRDITAKIEKAYEK
ncbi:MAG: tetratricopeptide repeat protein [bacterium]